MRTDPANAKDRHFGSTIVDCYDHFSRIADDQPQSTTFGFLLINGVFSTRCTMPVKMH